MSFRPYNQLTASAITDSRTNNTGVSISKGTPVRINSTGELDFVNVSVENQILNVAGVSSQTIPNGNAGAFLSSGKVEDVTTTATFGDLVYISKTGTLTEVKPSIGVAGFLAGDFVVSLGVIAKNETNPLLKDLIINIERKGQL